MNEETIKKLQAKAMADLQKDLAKPSVSADAMRAERQVFVFELARTRFKKNISQKALAAKAGLKQPYISSIESGKANPGLNTLLKIAKALDANLVLN
jgi:DNA-binding XRE family transcriptional regulator